MTVSKNEPSSIVERIKGDKSIEVIDAFTMRLEMARIFYRTTVARAMGISAPDVWLVMQTGTELGFPEMASLRVIDLIPTNKEKTEKQPAIRAQGMIALAARTGQLENWSVLESTDDHCTVLVKRTGWDEHVETFTLDNAKALGLLSKYNWKAQPRNMLKWRAVAAAFRVIFPDALLGLFTPEELNPDIAVDEMGAVVTMPEQAHPDEPVIEADFEDDTPTQPVGRDVNEIISDGDNPLPPSEEDYLVELVTEHAAWETILETLEMDDDQFWQEFQTWEERVGAVRDAFVAGEHPMIAKTVTLTTRRNSKSGDGDKFKLSFSTGLLRDVGAFSRKEFIDAGYTQFENFDIVGKYELVPPVEFTIKRTGKYTNVADILPAPFEGEQQEPIEL